MKVKPIKQHSLFNAKGRKFKSPPSHLPKLLKSVSVNSMNKLVEVEDVS